MGGLGVQMEKYFRLALLAAVACLSCNQNLENTESLALAIGKNDDCYAAASITNPLYVSCSVALDVQLNEIAKNQKNTLARAFIANLAESAGYGEGHLAANAVLGRINKTVHVVKYTCGAPADSPQGKTYACRHLLDNEGKSAWAEYANFVRPTCFAVYNQVGNQCEAAGGVFSYGSTRQSMQPRRNPYENQPGDLCNFQRFGNDNGLVCRDATRSEVSRFLCPPTKDSTSSGAD